MMRTIGLTFELHLAPVFALAFGYGGGRLLVIAGPVVFSARVAG